MFDIITIGSATRDVFLESSDFRDVRSRQFTSGIGECLSLGSKNTVRRIFFSTGGGATNAAVTFARLGLKVACIARVGNDSAGEEIIKSLDHEGVDTRFIQKDVHNATAYSTLLMHGPGERTILVYRGASVKLSLDALLKAVSLKRVLRRRQRFGLETKWFYITSLGGNLALIKKIWSLACVNNIKIAWNPGGEELKLGWRKLLPFIKQCEVFNVNREEANYLLGTTPSVLGVAMSKLCGHARVTLITDGKCGAYCCFRASELRRTPQQSEGRKVGLAKFFVSSLGTKPHNTTGAGDAFGSGFVVGLEAEPRRTPHPPLLIESGGEIRRFNLENKIRLALRLAILNADSVIRQMGAKAGILKKMPSKKELDMIKIKQL